jgi:hypothetical protein
MKDLNNLSDDELDKMLMDKMSKSQAGGSDFESMSDEDLNKKLFQKIMSKPAPKDKDNDTMAAIEGLGQGLTAGYLPQLQAKMEPLTDRIFGLFDDDSEYVEKAPWSQTFSNDENYMKSRDANIKRNKELAENNPISYNAAQIGGGITTGIVAAPAKLVTTTAKGASIAGTAYGLLANPGDREGIVDELQLTPRLRNAVLGAFTGYGAQKGLDKIAKISKPLAERLARGAERRAAAALGLQKHLRKKMTQGEIDDVGDTPLIIKSLIVHFITIPGK